MDSTRDGQLELRIASSAVDRAAVYRFRYHIYVEQMQRRQVHADHEDKRVCEPLDELGVVVAAFQGGRVVATLRTNIMDDPATEYYRRLYRTGLFADVPLGQIAVTSKLMVAPEYRGTPLVMRLVGYVARHIHYPRDIRFDLIDCNKPLIPFFKRLGYNSYLGWVFHREYGNVHPMFLATRDLEYLAARRSPFLRAARALGVTQCLTSEHIRATLTRGAACGR